MPRRLLLLPLLSPLLAALVLGALNPRPALSLRLLTWSSPALPLGAWISGAALGGALLSGAGTSMALRLQPAALRRRVRLERGDRQWDETTPRHGDQRRSSPSSWRPWSDPQSDSAASDREAWVDVKRGISGPTPAPGDPLPTMTVPFRVIRRPDGARAATPRAEPAAAGFRARGAEPSSVALVDDWDSRAEDDW